MSRFRTLFIAATCALLAAPASAEWVPYWRLSAIAEQSADTQFTDSTCSPADGVALYFGCIEDADGRTLGARGDFGSSVGIEVAVGLSPVAGLWRSEIALTHQPHYRFRGNANFLDSGETQPVRADLTHTRLEWRGYLELAELVDWSLGRFKPYLGAGLAVTHNRLRTTTYDFPELANQPAQTLVPGASRAGVGATLHAGTGWKMSEEFVLDVGIFYGHHGDVGSGRGNIEIFRSGERVAEVEVAPTEARLRTLGLSVGMRQRFP